MLKYVKIKCSCRYFTTHYKLKISDRILTAHSADPCNTSIPSCGSVPVFMTYRPVVITKSGTEKQQQYFLLKKKKKKGFLTD